MKVPRIALKIIILILLIIVAVCVDYLMNPNAFAEETTGYIMCADFVYVRPFPNKRCEEIGRLETGDAVHLDGTKKNGYLHCVDTGLEQSDGWVFAGYVVYDEPSRVFQKATIVSGGRLAARKYVNGKRIKWLKPLASLTVYYWSDEWCVTNCGYVRSEYLELEGE